MGGRGQPALLLCRPPPRGGHRRLSRRALPRPSGLPLQPRLPDLARVPAQRDGDHRRLHQGHHRPLRGPALGRPHGRGDRGAALADEVQRRPPPGRIRRRRAGAAPALRPCRRRHRRRPLRPRPCRRQRRHPGHGRHELRCRPRHRRRLRLHHRVRGGMGRAGERALHRLHHHRRGRRLHRPCRCRRPAPRRAAQRRRRPRPRLLRPGRHRAHGDRCQRGAGPPRPRLLPRRRDDPRRGTRARGGGRAWAAARAHARGDGAGDPGDRGREHGGRHPADDRRARHRPPRLCADRLRRRRPAARRRCRGAAGDEEGGRAAPSGPLLGPRHAAHRPPRRPRAHGQPPLRHGGPRPAQRSAPDPRPPGGRRTDARRAGGRGAGHRPYQHALCGPELRRAGAARHAGARRGRLCAGAGGAPPPA